ncbi:MAG TPA: 23S rRNA (guanosine(2251)-2'-O)-methyltransferase RlmB, partial [Chroococcales cyanobacterium]
LESVAGEGGQSRGADAEGRVPEVNKIFIVPANHPDRRIERIKQLAKGQRIPVVVCERRKLDQMVGEGQVHQGIAAQVSPVEFHDLSDFLADLNRQRSARGLDLNGCVIAAVDGIEDPHNLGAIIRVAEASGVVGLILPARRTAGLTGSVAKTSAGALATLPVIRVGNLVNTLLKLKDAGFWVAGLDAHEGDVYFRSDLVRPLVLVIGSEGKGIGRLVREHCDMLLKIPMIGKTESLNASVAAGIVFYEVVRQLYKGNDKAREGKEKP